MSAPESLVSKFKHDENSLANTSSLWIVTYFFYKIATPIRYPTTIGLTRFAVHHLRAKGFLAPIEEQDRLRNLAREGYNLHKGRVQRIVHSRRQQAIQKAKEYVSKRPLSRK
ncbi:hypothetical protein Ciccas_012636 [Cichlidogyrus casuarinus]|uniref:Uncharacterized protein n=1 Tax=Cichlidogyrus casuarinus TaxID=1844966 RepID=A0ABD2PPM5_9PLAT